MNNILSYDIINPNRNGLIAVSYSFDYINLGFELNYDPPRNKRVLPWPLQRDILIPGSIYNISKGRKIIDNILEPIEDGKVLEINDTPPGNGKNESYKAVFYTRTFLMLPFIELVFEPLEAKMTLGEDGKIITHVVPIVRRYEFDYGVIANRKADLSKKDIAIILGKVKKTIGDCLIFDKQTMTTVKDFYL